MEEDEEKIKKDLTHPDLKASTVFLITITRLEPSKLDLSMRIKSWKNTWIQCLLRAFQAKIKNSISL